MGTLGVLITSFYLGILTSISPCPLATNIVAISYISKQITHPYLVFVKGVIYSVGRTFIYILLSFVIIQSLLDTPLLSHFLQKYMNKIIGPILIIVGMFLVELVKVNFNFSLKSNTLQGKIADMGLLGAFLLGMFFALSFCPTSTALFFGGLIPLATKSNSSFMVPTIYGISTGIPVIIFAFLISFATTKVSKVYNMLSNVEIWARYITGGLFILIGIYLTLTNIFGFNLSI